MPGSALVRHVVTFGRVLREAGLEVGPGRIQDALTGLDRVELARREDVYWTLRQTLVSRAEDLDAFDSAFTAWFERAPGRPLIRKAQTQTMRPVLSFGDEGDDAASGGQIQSKGWSDEEVLHHKDFASLTQIGRAHV